MHVERLTVSRYLETYRINGTTYQVIPTQTGIKVYANRQFAGEFEAYQGVIPHALEFASALVQAKRAWRYGGTSALKAYIREYGYSPACVSGILRFGRF